MRQLAILLFVLPILSGCDQSRDEHNHPDLTTDQELFEYHCASCHGPEGKGNFLKGIPANIYTEKYFSQVVTLIRQGDQHKKSKMTIFQTMPEEEARAIVRHMLELKEQFEESGKDSQFILKPKSD